MASDYDVSYSQDIFDICEIRFRIQNKIANQRNRYTKLRKSDARFLTFHIIVRKC